MRILISLIFLWAIFVVAGCQTNFNAAESLPEITPSPSLPLLSTPQPVSTTQAEIMTTPTLDEFGRISTKMPERVPPTEGTTPVTGEVPTALLDSIMKDLADRTSTNLETITVIQDQAIVWNNGSLGCPKPGEFYTQALVRGYWVILEVDGAKYDYRVAASGYFFLCEGGVPPVSPPATPSS